MPRQPNKKKVFNNTGVERKAVAMYTKDNELVKTFESITAAGQYLGHVSGAGVSAVLHGRTKSCGGYIFKYVSD